MALMDDPAFKKVHALFQLLWTRAVGTPDYVKQDWTALDNAIVDLARKAEARSRYLAAFSAIKRNPKLAEEIVTNILDHKNWDGSDV